MISDLPLLSRSLFKSSGGKLAISLVKSGRGVVLCMRSLQTENCRVIGCVRSLRVADATVTTLKLLLE